MPCTVQEPFPPSESTQKTWFICCSWNFYMVVFQSLQDKEWDFGFNLYPILIFYNYEQSKTLSPLKKKLVLVPELKQRPECTHSFFSFLNLQQLSYMLKFNEMHKLSYQDFRAVSTEVCRTALLPNLFGGFWRVGLFVLIKINLTTFFKNLFSIRPIKFWDCGLWPNWFIHVKIPMHYFELFVHLFCPNDVFIESSSEGMPCVD